MIYHPFPLAYVFILLAREFNIFSLAVPSMFANEGPAARGAGEKNGPPRGEEVEAGAMARSPF